MNVKNALTCSSITGLALASFPLKVHADDIYKGVISHTHWQYDQRIAYTEKERNRVTTTTWGSSSILKYWNGDKKGIFTFVHVPWKHIDNETHSSAGIGDVTLALGPRGRLDFGEKGNLHWLSYAGAVLPTGDTSAKPTLGNGHADFKAGCFATALTLDKKFEADISIEYMHASTLHVSDEIAAGFVIGGALPSNFRAATGLTSIIKKGGAEDGAYSMNYRLILRKNVSPQWHLVAIGDIGIKSKRMPLGFGATLIARYNF